MMVRTLTDLFLTPLMSSHCSRRIFMVNVSWYDVMSTCPLPRSINVVVELSHLEKHTKKKLREDDDLATSGDEEDDGFTHDGLATVTQPPQLPAFDLINCQTRICQCSTSTSTANFSLTLTSDITHMASIVKDLFAFARRAATPDSSTSSRKLSTLSLPYTRPCNTRTALSHFFKYAEDTLGIDDATSYEANFKTKRYGPDILHLFDNSALLDMGLVEGD
ncbi:hypothetical protein FPV67DRAFT_1446429 [Lyophyllum atratum]|nr:hypothetical protein FPV67DRAFT_1446429 [Lyophyllum atratum]